MLQKSVWFILLLASSAFARPVAVHTGRHEEIFLPAHASSDPVIEHTGYTLQYSEKDEQALWVAYELTASEVHHPVGRSDNFREDPAIPTGSATLMDYRKSGYDRGHLAPAGDMGWSGTAMSESFFMSNMSPQIPGFNRGIWKELEEQVRAWAGVYDTLDIVAGPVLTQKPLGAIGPDHVTVPAAYYKVILDRVKPDIKGIGFIMPNAASTEPEWTFAVSIDQVERTTGLDFFPVLPDSLEEAVESNADVSRWTWTDTRVAASGRPAPSRPPSSSAFPWKSGLLWLVIIVIFLAILIYFLW